MLAVSGGVVLLCFGVIKVSKEDADERCEEAKKDDDWVRFLAKI